MVTTDSGGHIPAQYQDFLHVTTLKDPGNVPTDYSGYILMGYKDCVDGFKKYTTDSRSAPANWPHTQFGTMHQYDMAEVTILRIIITCGGTDLIGNKDCKLRLCADYWTLNKATVRNPYHLPLISAMLVRLCGAQNVTMLQLGNSNHLIKMKNGDEYRTVSHPI